MNENKKEKHTLRNVLITLLVLCVLGGGGYFGYIKYQEYQEEQEKIAAKEERQAARQEKVDLMLEGLSEEDQAKLTEEEIWDIAGYSDLTQSQELIKHGVVLNLSDKYGENLNSVDLGDFIGSSATALAEGYYSVLEENYTNDCTGMYIALGNGEIQGEIVFDRMYGIESESEYAISVKNEGNTLYPELTGLDCSLINPYKLGIHADTDTVYKSYNLSIYTRINSNESTEYITLDENQNGESRFYVNVFDGHGHDSIVLY